MTDSIKKQEIMRKYLLILSTAIFSVVIFCSCGGGKSAPKGDNERGMTIENAEQYGNIVDESEDINREKLVEKYGDAVVFHEETENNQ